jgi:hypothetical protein
LTLFALTIATAPHAWAQNQPSRPVALPELRGEDPIPGLRGFGVVLVQGEMQPGQQPTDVPPAALKALNDLKDFLPYKNYKLLDTQWTMGSGRLAGRLRGPENSGYYFEVQTRRGEDVPIVVSRFVLRAESAHDEARAVLTPKPLAQAQSVRMAALGFSRNLIDTSFSMDLGETVVVGTSRIQGNNNALIVLLTAIGRTAPAK